jgi:hypothetical protein
VKGSETSKAAAESVEHQLPRLEAVVLGALRIAGLTGLTDKEGEATTGLGHETYSARRRSLVQKGLVGDGGERRRTPSGRKAVVWIPISSSGEAWVKEGRTTAPRAPTPKQIATTVALMRSLYKQGPERFGPGVIRTLQWLAWKGRDDG